MKESNIIGENVKTFRDVVIRRSSIGDNSLIADDAFVSDSNLEINVLVERRCMLFSANIGKRTTIGFNTVIRNCIIGSYSSIAWNVSIGGAEHYIRHLSTSFFSFDKTYGLVDETDSDTMEETYENPVIIGHDVWIAAGVQILRGCTICDGAVIGAGAVVIKDVGPYEIWAGVPARKISQRFDSSIVQKLTSGGDWWNLPDDIIKDNITLFRKDISKNDAEVILALCNKYNKN